MLNLDPIRRRALLDDSATRRDIFVLLAEVDTLRDSLGKVVMMWDEQISQGFPFLANSDLVPALREILAGYNYDRNI